MYSGAIKNIEALEMLHKAFAIDIFAFRRPSFCENVDGVYVCLSDGIAYRVEDVAATMA